jgi:hypothetical protein
LYTNGVCPAWETDTVRHLFSFSRLLIGVFLFAALAASWCAAQDGSGGFGNVPMAPAAPGGPGNFNQPVIPRPPAEPPAASRPPSWPGQTGEASPWMPPDQRSAPSQSPPADGPPPGEMKACTGSRIVAHVGSDVILDSELIIRKIDLNQGTFEIVGHIDHILEMNKDRIPADQWDAQREMLMEKILPDLIRTKLVCLDAKRTIPSERWPEVEKQLGKAFDEVAVEKMLMKQFKVSSVRELDQKLRALGTSIEREKRAFIEIELTQQWIGQHIKRNEETTIDQMAVYYRQHQDEFTKPARARWEELMVRFAKYPNKAAAYDAIARMGNQVFAGAPFADVARAGSDGVEAPKGGRRDWTAKGSLACQELDRALFGLPIGQLGPIIEGPTGFHIIRVTEREDAAVMPFLEAQVAIRDKIVKQRSAKQLHEYLARLEARTPVKTIFDSDANPQTATRPGQPELRR